MAKEKNAAPKKILILDTNAIYARNETELIAPALSAQLLEIQKLNPAEVTLPRIVVQERLQQCLGTVNVKLNEIRSASRALLKLSEVRLDLDDHKLIGIKTARTLFQRLKALGITVTKLCFETVGWRNLVSRAVRHLPPFSNESDEENRIREKGFKDAICLETVMQIVNTFPSREVIFVTDDKLLQEAVKQRAAKQEKVVCYKSLDDLLSLLRLNRDDPEYAEELLRAADSQFYNPNAKDDFFHSLNIGDSLELEFRSLIFGPPKDVLTQANLDSNERAVLRSMHSSGEPFIRFCDTRYVGKLGRNKRKWVSHIGYCAHWAAEYVSAEIPSFYLQYVKTVIIAVEWSAIINPGSTLTQPEWISTDVVLEDLREMDEGDLTGPQFIRGFPPLAKTQKTPVN